MLESGDVNVVDKINVEAGWECTTCQACTEVCPVGNHVEKADEIRSFQVLAEGDVPQEYQKLLRNLQETGNTEGASSSELLNELLKKYFDSNLIAKFSSMPAWRKASNSEQSEFVSLFERFCFQKVCHL